MVYITNKKKNKYDVFLLSTKELKLISDIIMNPYSTKIMFLFRKIIDINSNVLFNDAMIFFDEWLIFSLLCSQSQHFLKTKNLGFNGVNKKLY